MSLSVPHLVHRDGATAGGHAHAPNKPLCSSKCVLSMFGNCWKRKAALLFWLLPASLPREARAALLPQQEGGRAGSWLAGAGGRVAQKHACTHELTMPLLCVCFINVSPDACRVSHSQPHIWFMRDGAKGLNQIGRTTNSLT